MVRRLGFLLLLTTVISVGFNARTASAHILKQDNGVTAVLHIVPFDAPVSNEPTRVEIEFSNTSHTFKIQDYSVKLRVLDSGSQVMTQSVEAAYLGTATTGLATVTFPKADVYTFDVTGMSDDPSQSPFHVSYSVRVTAGAQVNKPKSSLDAPAVLGIGAAAFVVLAMFAAKQIIGGGRYNKVKPKEK